MSHSRPSSEHPDTSAPAASVALAPISREQAPVLQNLFELYAHDFSEHVPLQIKANGRFELAPSEAWWSSAGHHPFFIHERRELAGFALARRGSRVTGAADVMDVAEFFVVRGARRRNVGMTAAHALFRAFPGGWEIRVRHTNAAALEFWLQVVEAWNARSVVQSAFSVDGVDWHLLRLDA